MYKKDKKKSDYAELASFLGKLARNQNKVDYPDFVYNSFQAATPRKDFGKTISLTIPQGYHEKVRACWQMYIDDSLIRRMVDRCIEFAINGTEWELKPTGKKGVDSKLEIEKEFWNEWSAIINDETDNVLPGLDEILKWGVKHSLLEAMSVYDWEWDKRKIGKYYYDVPVRMLIHSASSIALDRPNGRFVEEKIYLKLDKNSDVSDSSSINFAVDGGPSSYLTRDYVEIKQIGKRVNAATEGFALKYMWTPGELSGYRYQSISEIGIGLYPNPPLVGLIPVVKKKLMMRSADISLIDGVVNAFILWKIGDANTEIEPPKIAADGTTERKGTIAEVMEIIQSQSESKSLDPIVQLFLPYYVDLLIKTPDVQLLLDANKYISCTTEILEAFGIIILPGGGNNRTSEDVEVANLEEMLESIRKFHLRRFIEKLARKIVERNKDKLSVVPNLIFKPLNTKNAQFLQGLQAITKMGKISQETLLSYYNVDSSVENQRIRGELEDGTKSRADENSPIQFVQSAQLSDGNEKINKSINPQDGRPIGVKELDQRKIKTPQK